MAVVTDWKTINASLFEALAVERVAMFVVLSIIMLVAVFNILSSLIMLVRAKTRDIAILRTMGATRRSLVKIFVDHRVPDRRAGHGRGADRRLRVPLFPPGRSCTLVEMLTGQNLWDPSIRFLTELPARTDPVEIDGDLRDGAGVQLPRHALSRVEGGEHRSGAGAAL